MQGLFTDLRDTWRGLRHDRLWAAATIGTLALTLGALIAIFAIVSSVLLRPLGYPDPTALISIREIVPSIDDRYPTLPVTLRHFDEWRNRTTTFASLAAMDWRTSTLTGAGDAQQVTVLRTSGTLFDVMQVPVAVGRGLTRDDENVERPAVTVISEPVWRERFGSDPAIIGRSLTLGGAPFTIVGVMPRGYALPRLQALDESGSVTREFAAIVPFRVNVTTFAWMGQFNYGVVGRMKPGMTLAQARAEMDVLQAAVAEIASRETHQPVELRASLTPLDETIVGPVRRGLLLLLGASAGLLLIACANLANLTLTRTIRRLRESALRLSLGASRWRLVRGVIVDQVVLAMIGVALGLALAQAAIRAFVIAAPVSLPRAQDVSIDAAVIAFAIAAAFVSAVGVAVVPAWRVARGNLEPVLRSGGRSSERGSVRVRHLLLASQVALSVMLLMVSGLFVSSLTRLLRADTGFSGDGAVTIEVAPVAASYPNSSARAALYDRIAERVRALPGVTAAAWTSALPLTGETWVDGIRRPDDDASRAERPSANYRFIGPEYFQAIGMPIMQGRGIEPQDRTSTVTPAVINARAARTMWPGEVAVGREFTRANPEQRFRVVGVVSDGRVTALESEPPLMVYVPYWFNNEGKSVLVVRAAGDPMTLVPEIRRSVRDVDPDVAVSAVAPLAQLVDAAAEGRRYQATL
ncbi:MAG: ABC transporter permease, partial [Acidobacteria bacterium]|nr:ABC transporter permease [Acidobacteriota bacterium]